MDCRTVNFLRCDKSIMFTSYCPYTRKFIHNFLSHGIGKKLFKPGGEYLDILMLFFQLLLCLKIFIIGCWRNCPENKAILQSR